MENKLKEKERDEARKELLQKDAELAELRTKFQHIEGRKSQINLKVDQKTETLKFESTKMEERMLLQKEEYPKTLKFELTKTEERMLLQKEEYPKTLKFELTKMEERTLLQKEELDMLRQRLGEKVLQDTDGGRLLQEPFQLDPCLVPIEEESDANILRFPDKVCLSTVFEEDEEGRESIEDEIDKEVVRENSWLDFFGQGNQFLVFIGSLSCWLGLQNRFTGNSKNPASARKTRIQNIFRLCGKHRELAKQVKTSSPPKCGSQDQNKQPSPLALGKELGSNLGLQEEQPLITPKYKLVADTKLKESPNMKENNSPNHIDSDAFVDIDVRLEASKELSGGLIRKLKVLKNSSLADLRKLIEIDLEGDSKEFTFLLLGYDASGAPVFKEKEATTQVNKLPTCNNQMNGHLACLRPLN
ncbi:hypothetical protein ZIOFF_038658 [Zingiber officinale]|uniref:Uncharacterized protein n=1 Tax=Zingiber officinale TaxID=94328 RepID=A0A8J5G325_ZINOF|nr:hypothetical protein ZIOFF_038658 [Zingiber officinale]